MRPFDTDLRSPDLARTLKKLGSMTWTVLGFVSIFGGLITLGSVVVLMFMGHEFTAGNSLGRMVVNTAIPLLVGGVVLLWLGKRARADRPRTGNVASNRNDAQKGSYVHGIILVTLGSLIFLMPIAYLTASATFLELPRWLFYLLFMAAPVLMSLGVALIYRQDRLRTRRMRETRTQDSA